MMTTCPDCGTEAVPGASFCGECGRPLEPGARLVAVDPDGKSETHSVGEELVIGREPGTLALPDRALSRRHARVFLRDDGYVLEDLQSTNGVFVALRGETRIRPADLVLIGKQPHRFVYGEEPGIGPAFLPVPGGGREGSAKVPGDPELKEIRLYVELRPGAEPGGPEAVFVLEADDPESLFVRIHEPRELEHGDSFVAGSHTFRFEQTE